MKILLSRYNNAGRGRSRILVCSLEIKRDSSLKCSKFDFFLSGSNVPWYDFTPPSVILFCEAPCLNNKCVLSPGIHNGGVPKAGTIVLGIGMSGVFGGA